MRDKNKTKKQKEKTYSEKQIEEALTKGPSAITSLFIDEKVEDDDLFEAKRGYASQLLRNYIGLTDGEGKPLLKGKCFIGVNVKTSSSEPLRPVSYRTTEKTVEYVPNPDIIAEGGKITDLENPNQEEVFKWDPGKWNYEDEKKAVDNPLEKYKGAISSDVSDEIIDHFRSPYGNKNYDPQKGIFNKDSGEGNKYNILGDIYYNALGITQGACWVWLYHFDYDISNGKFLSFILAIGNEREDLDILMGADENLIHKDINEVDRIAWYSPRNMLRNYILLVKARYVRKIERLRQKESVKSAVAAIMSRNMSHNLGSHYLYYTKMQLSAMADKHKEFAPDIRGAARVLGYMQARMDYLATIVSGDKYPYGSVFFKGQIFDELTIDDFSKRHFEEDAAEPDRIYKRTTNYLLQNLILSEDFTRGPILDDLPNLLEEKNENDEITKKRKNIRLQIRIGDSQDGLFTGLPDILHQKKERKVKLEISKICMALPGGIMSIHAFFNVVENLIRNSAKYMKDDFKKEKELVVTIAITELPEGKSQSGKPLPFRYQFVIYDNKGNAFAPCAPKSLIDKMNDELVDLKILNEKNELDKSNKGLKEMLFSTLWMRSYTRKESLADILARWDRMSVSSDEERSNKRNEISEHAFEYVAVDENGKVMETKGTLETGASDRQNLNLGIRFELPKYRMMENLDVDKIDENLLEEKGVNNFTDMICVGPNCQDLSELKTIFTRVYDKGFARDEEDAEEATGILKDILAQRFPDIDDYKICMDGKEEKGYSDCDKKVRGIYFERHVKKLDEMQKYVYCEAISGENFTNTMMNIFSNSFVVSEDQIVRVVKEEKTKAEETPKKSFFDWFLGGKRQTEETKQEKAKPKVRDIGDFKDGASEYFALKIKESALTRITLVDERFFNDMRTRGQDAFLTCRNIRVLNLKSVDTFPKNSEMSGGETDNRLVVKHMFDGNDFCDGKDATHFLSIHLGMIEKIVKDDSAWVKAQHLETETLTQRVNKLMDMIKKAFQTEQGELFISIHSGRGNFSKELDESLKEYRFISVSAIESVYSDSKFLLAQLFYNTVYMGKGELNEGKDGQDGD